MKKGKNNEGNSSITIANERRKRIKGKTNCSVIKWHCLESHSCLFLSLCTSRCECGGRTVPHMYTINYISVYTSSFFHRSMRFSSQKCIAFGIHERCIQKPTKHSRHKRQSPSYASLSHLILFRSFVFFFLSPWFIHLSYNQRLSYQYVCQQSLSHG